MDYSQANHALWNVIIQLGYIAGVILLANFVRQKLSFVRNTMLPIAVLGGFILLAAKIIGIARIDNEFMEMLTYHGIALGFIAMSLRVPDSEYQDSGNNVGLKSGAVIVSTYMIQGIVGLIITIFLGLTFMPDLFKAAGLLLPMGYGQGPGQANNIGSSYQAMGFEGGHSFGLAIAAMGYIVACVVGVIMLNVIKKRGGLKKDDLSTGGGRESWDRKSELDDLSIDYFGSRNEIPISESIDKLTIQIAMMVLVYVITFLISSLVTSMFSAIGEGVASTVNGLIWGFNFIIGSAVAIGLRTLLENLKKRGMVKRQYQNNYLLNRLSGVFFDLMIIAGISSIDIEEIKGLVLPFILLCVFGGIATWIHLAYVCRITYKDYYNEALISMFGMLTGTISSGVILLREIDPDMKTPAGNNLVVGSSFGILLGAPVLVLVGLAPKSDIMCFVTLALCIVYYLILNRIIKSKTTLGIPKKKPSHRG